MWYKFHKLVSICMVLLFGSLILAPIIYSNYILKFTYDFDWSLVIIFGLLEVVILYAYLAKYVSFRVNYTIGMGKLKKKFSKNGTTSNEADPDKILIREELFKKMLRRGYNNFYKMNFANLDLQGMDLRGIKFSYCSFYNCKLNNAKFERAILDGCIFDKADFTNANLTNATISGVSLHFDNAIMTNTILDNIKINRTLPYNIRLEQLCLSELENNKVTGIKELKEKYICKSKVAYKRSLSSIDSFLIIPREAS